MIRIFGTILAALAGLAFGSFLNVCVTRWPAGESVVKPRSHCRACNRTLAWWENVPLLSWFVLRGRCRTCGAGIGWRYPLVELAVGLLWAIAVWQALGPTFGNRFLRASPLVWVSELAGKLILYWLLIALAVLDAENLWLPNLLTLPGIALGLAVNSLVVVAAPHWSVTSGSRLGAVVIPVASAIAAGGMVLLIRWVYWLVRRQEGIGMGDAKLMAMLGAWLGLPGALLAFVVGVILGTGFALIVLALPRRGPESWAMTKLPLGTFLCIGGIVSALWGQAILNAYLRWSGFA